MNSHAELHQAGALAHESHPDFVTERLQLSIFLHATERLQFLRVESAGRTGKLRFVFADPDRAGAQIEFEFDRGATCSASALFASQKFLRRAMTKTQNIGETENASPYIRNPR